MSHAVECSHAIRSPFGNELQGMIGLDRALGLGLSH